MKKKILAIVTAFMFAGLMILNVNTTVNDANFSITGFTSLAYGTSPGGGGGGLTCYTTATQCGWTGSCIDYVRCTNCNDAEGKNLRDSSTCTN